MGSLLNFSTLVSGSLRYQLNQGRVHRLRLLSSLILVHDFTQKAKAMGQESLVFSDVISFFTVEENAVSASVYCTSSNSWNYK